MDGGSALGLHVVRARLVLVAALVLLLVIVPVQRAGAVGAQAAPASLVAVTLPGPGLVGPSAGTPAAETPSAETAVERPTFSSSRGGEDRRPVLARAGARPTAEHARVSALDHEVFARFD